MIRLRSSLVRPSVPTPDKALERVDVVTVAKQLVDEARRQGIADEGIRQLLEAQL